MTDLELVKGCIKEDRRCQNTLYKRYFPLMSSIALRYTNSPDDIIYKLNGGFYKILLNLSKYDSQYSLATFIRNVLINYFIDEFRKEKKHITNIEFRDHADLEAGVTFNQGESDMEAKELLDILNQLPEVTRKVFNLFAIDGYKHSEISSMLGISVGTSKWHVSEARRQLKKNLEAIAKEEIKEINTQVKL
jgi:RNA polymerase sigma factor (sigma-70 family)